MKPKLYQNLEQALKRLGRKLRKQDAPAPFKANLREQLMERAQQMNQVQSRSSLLQIFSMNSMSKHMGRVLTPITAIILVVAVASTGLFPGGNVVPQLVNVAEAADYYELTPENSDPTGVAVNSSFILSSKDELSLRSVERNLLVSPETELTLESVDANSIRITPKTELDEGEIYQFELQAQNIQNAAFARPYSWAYQITDELSISSTIPGDQRSGVPVNSAVEVSFNMNHIDKASFEAGFSISPAVPGRFETSGKTATFIPSQNLKAETLYTVTIGANVAVKDSEQSLGEAYSFQFETDGSTRGQVSLNPRNEIYEFNPNQNPEIDFYYYDASKSETEPLVADINVYAYPNGEAYLSALQEAENSAPRWSYYAERNFRNSTNGLQKALTLSELPSIQKNDYSNERSFNFETTLKAGHYLAEIQVEDEIAQVFLQVSNHAAFFQHYDKESLVWLNDIESKQAIKNTRVEFIDTKLSAKTDADGVAVIEGIQALNDNSAHYAKVSASDMDTYYKFFFYQQDLQAQNDYWTLLQTDRPVYQTDDTLSYWGFVQGRDQKAPSGKAQLYVYEGWFPFYIGQEFPDLDENEQVLYKEEIDLSDGTAFSGKIELEKMNPGYYNMVVIQGDKQLANGNFRVERYTKPAYQVSVTTEHDMYYIGDTVNIDIQAAFFEGTPVANTDFRITIEGEEQEITTDENGQASLSVTASKVKNSYYAECGLAAERSCPLVNWTDVVVRPINEELADIQANLYYRVFSTKLAAHSAEVSRTSIEMTTQFIDLDAVDRTWSDDFYSEDLPAYYGDLAPNTNVEFKIIRRDIIEEEVEYYDAVDKVTKTRIERRSNNVTENSFSKQSDANGKLEFDYAFQDGKGYNIYYKITDADGDFYVSSEYLYGRDYEDPGNYDRIVVQSKEEGPFKLGDRIDIHVAASSTNDTPLDLSDNSAAKYLFMENHRGLQSHTVENDSERTVRFDPQFAPNMTVAAALFDGVGYEKSVSSAYIAMDETVSEVELDVELDQETYEPGETATLRVRSNEAGYVVVNLVDEAYYALYPEQFRNPLDILYGNVASMEGRNYISHESALNTTVDEGGLGGCFVAGTQILMADGSTKAIEDIEEDDFILTFTDPHSKTLTKARVSKTIQHVVNQSLLVNGSLGVTGEHVLFVNGQWQLAENLKVGDQLTNKDGEHVLVESIETVYDIENVYNFEVEDYHTYIADGFYVHNDKGEIRQDFKDTALFELVETNASGLAVIEFELPDNITQWRVTASFVKGDRLPKAGFASEKLNVSKKLFAEPVINPVYLEGDRPQIPMRAFGTSLNADSELNFTLSIPAIDFAFETVGKAFDAVYAQLPELELGDYRIETTAESASLKDSIALETEVVDSHMSQNQTWETELSTSTKLKGSADKRTQVRFINSAAASLLPTLYGGLHEDGTRVDQILSHQVSIELLNEYFDENYSATDIDHELYQDARGGIRLLPYGDPQLRLSALAADLAQRSFNEKLLKSYFEAQLNAANTLSEKVLALYGLSALGEPVLLELDYLVENQEANSLNANDKLFIALAYDNLGAEQKMRPLFLELGEDTKFLNEGTSTEKRSKNALMASLAEALNSESRDDFWDAALNWDQKSTVSEDPLFGLEKLRFIRKRLENGLDSTASFHLNGQRVTLEGLEIHEQDLTPKQLQNAKFSKIEGEITVYTRYTSPLDPNKVATDKRIKFTREYRVNGAPVSESNPIQAGAVIEVHMQIEMPRNLHGGYEVREYLPSGLQSLTQKQTWFPYGSRYEGGYIYPYHTDRQALRFYFACSEKVVNGQVNCQEDFYYLARVINPGDFVLEPASIQSYTDEKLMQFSGARSRLQIQP